MPYKHNENRRHKIKKSRYKVTNWHNYNHGLRQRSEVTIWFTEEAIADWHPFSKNKLKESVNTPITITSLQAQFFNKLYLLGI